MKHLKWMLLVVAACLLLTACAPSQSDPQTQPTTGGQEVSYTITVTNPGGLYLKDVGVFIYADSTLADLVWFDRTDDNGKLTFTAPQKDTYVAVINEPPAGYAAEGYYPLTGTDTVIVLSTGGFSGDETFTYRLGDTVMDFSVTGPDGTEYTLSGLFADKQAVVLNFWYLECQPCRAEFPYLQEAYEKYSDRIAVIGMNPVNDDGDAIAAFAEEMGITFPLTACDPKWEQIMQLTEYPTTVVIDRFGNICLIHRGSIDDTATFEKIFDYFASEDYTPQLIESIDQLPEVQEGTAENPTEVGGLSYFQVTVEPEQEVYVDVYRVGGMYMRVTGEGEFYVLHEGKSYPSENGEVSFVVTTGDNYTPAKLGFGNSSQEPLVLDINFSFLPGTYGNPYTLNLGEFTAKVNAGNDQGVYYIYTAPEDGALTVQCLDATPGVGYGFTLYNLSSYAYRTLDQDGKVSDDGIPTLSVRVSEGDRVQLIVATEPDDEFNYPGGTFRLKAIKTDGSELDDGNTQKMDYTVKVVDTQGKGVPAVSITVDVDGKPTVFKTDAQGILKFSLPVAIYEATVTVPAGYTCEQPEITLSEETPDHTVTLTPQLTQNHDYVVRIVDENNAPLANVKVIRGGVLGTTDDTGTVTFPDLPEDRYTVSVLPPDGYVAAQESYTFPEGVWEMTVQLEKERIPGTEGAPIAVSEYPFTISRIEPGQELYYTLDNAGGMVLTFWGENAYVIYDGVTHSANAQSVVSVELKAGDGQLVIFGNGAAQEQGYWVSLEHPQGSEENPQILTDISAFQAILEAGDTDGRFFSWTAPEDLEVTLTGDSGSIRVTVGDQNCAAPAVEGVTFEIAKGMKAQICVSAQVQPDGTYPAAQISVTGVSQKPNSKANPQVLTEISQVHAYVKENKPQGYYYSWTAQDAGTVIFALDQGSAGVTGGVTLTVGTQESTMVGDMVQADVEAGDTVLIQVYAAARPDGTYPAANITLLGSFVLGNSAQNPELLTSIENVTLVLETGDTDGYYYSWTAGETGTVIFTQTSGDDVNVILSCNGATASFGDGTLDDTGALAAMLPVAQGDKILIQVVSNDPTASAAAVLAGRLELPNSETNPIDVSGAFTTDLLESGEKLYYRIHGITGMELVIQDADAQILCGGETYEAVDGTVRVPLTQDGQILAICNGGSQTKRFYAQIQHILGSAENPIMLTALGSITGELSREKDYGCYYSWTAPMSGVVELTLAGVPDGVTAELILTVNANDTYQLSDFGDGKLQVALNNGDSVLLQVKVSPTTDGSVTINGRFVEDPNSETNPFVLTDVTQPVDVDLVAGDSDGCFYAWTAPGDGVVTFRLEGVPAGIQGNILLKCGTGSAALTQGTASLHVKNGETVTIQVTAGGEAALLTLVGGVEYDLGTAQNPQTVTDISLLTAQLEAGDWDGYHYLWTAVADGTVDFTVEGGKLTAYVDGVEAGMPITVENAGDVLLKMTATETAGAYPAANVTAHGTFTYKPGSPENPIVVTEYPYLTASVPAGETVYFYLHNADGTVITLTTGTDGCIIYNGQELSGGVEISGDAQLVAIRNDGTAASAYRMTQTYPVGSQQNPELITDILAIPERTMENGGVYYYKWTADGDGTLTITRTTGYSARLWVGDTATTVSTYGGATVDLTEGAELIIEAVDTASNGKASTIVFTTEYTYALGTTKNPEQIVLDDQGMANLATWIEAGDTDGYHHQWTVTGEGTLTITRGSSLSQAKVYINGEAKADIKTSAATTLYVERDDVVLIQLLNTSTTAKRQIQMKLAYTQAVGSRENPEILDSITGISVALAAGDDNGYHYSYTWNGAAGTTGTLYLNADVGGAAVVKLITVDDSGNESVATSSDGKIYKKISGGDTVLIQVIAQMDAQGYPALSAVLSGGVKLPASDPVESGKLRYTVTVTETNNYGITGLMVNFRNENGGSVAVVDVVNGEATADLTPGTYTVIPVDSNGAYYFDASVTVMLTQDVTSAELRVTRIEHVSENNVTKDDWFMTDYDGDGGTLDTWYAYNVSVGAVDVAVDTQQENYSAQNGSNCFFLFAPETTGTYRFTTVTPGSALAQVSLWSISAGGFNEMSNYDPETNSVTLEVLETQFANDNRPQYMVGIKCAPNVTGTVLVITDLQKIPQDINTFPTSDDWYSGYVPTAFSLELGAGQKIVPVDENKTYTVVYNPADGYYHFDSLNGPVVYVNLDYSRLSFKNMINPGGSTGTSFKRLWIEDGLCVRKENYTDLMTQYLLSACEITSGDTTYLLYPMTKDLLYMVEVGGERWWNIEYNNGAEYIFLDGDGNPEEVALTPGWLFAACYTE